MFDSSLHHRDAALVALGRQLLWRGYRFTTVTPATHARVNARSANQLAVTLEDVFGWSRPFLPEILPEDLLNLLRDGDAIAPHGNLCRSTVRFSSLDQLLFMHSAFPTEAEDAVFFGPDTYRFARALQATFGGKSNGVAQTIVDIGCGSGAGGIYLRSLLPRHAQVDLILGDINLAAVRFATINAAINRIPQAHTVHSDIASHIPESANIIIANPPYLVDGAERVYRHGGGALGFDLSLRIVDEALPRLVPGGCLLLYTGAPVVQGADRFRQAVVPRLTDCTFTYEEYDPDVFGEELDEPTYAAVDRIAAVVLTVTAPGGLANGSQPVA
ncbi:MAG: class I SAM-dependent methyltransferase [Micropepsaceae bacterium]